MPSDAFMELSHPDVWGETYDAQFGEEGRGAGAFEIALFEFGVTSNREDFEDAMKSRAEAAASAATAAASRTGGSASGGTSGSSGASAALHALQTQPTI